jgi:Transposase IS116/IS110/IS902 family
MLDSFDLELAPLDRQLRVFARRQAGCRALIQRLYGVGPVSATAIVAELGDARSSSDDAVRHAGLDITVFQSDQKRAPGRLSHEGPELLRWALYEAAVSAARASSPDRGYYLQVAERLDHNRACLSVARKLCRRAHHLLRELGEDALAPIEQPDKEALAAAAQPDQHRRPPAHRHADALRPAPPDPRRQRPPAWTALRDRAAASNPRRDHTRSIILSPDQLCPSTQVRLAARAPESLHLITDTR